jgi:Protein-disulfide isomerase
MNRISLAIGAALVFTASLVGAFAAPQQVFPDDRSLGNPKAPVQIIEYAAPTCPHCAHFSKTVMPDLKKAYIDTGKVNFVFRIFPIDAADGAIAGMAVCLPKARYFEFLDLAFKRQDLWDPDGYGVSDVRGGLDKLGAMVGLSSKKIDECLANDIEMERVNRIAEHGAKTYNIHAVPTLLVDGTEVPPQERDFAHLKTRIDALLAKTAKPAKK